MQALQRRWPGVRFKGKQVGDRSAGSGKLEVWSVNDLRCERTSASNTDRLRTMVGFLAASMASRACLRSAQILGVRQFVRRIVKDFVRS